MIRSNLYFLFFLCITTTNLCGQPKPDEHVVGQVRKFRLDYTKAMLSKNSDVLENYFHQNLRLMPEFQNTVIGKSNALRYFKSFLSRFDVVEYSHTEFEILDLKSRVVESGTFKMKVKLKSKTDLYEVEGKYQDIWENSNGSLKLITVAWNHNQRSE